MALAFAQKSKKPASLQVQRRRTKKQTASRPGHIEQAQFAVGFGQPARTSIGAPMIQTKLKIGEPDDQYEKEADRVADAVMRMADPLATGASANSGMSGSGNQPGNGSLDIQRKCTDCAMEEDVKLRRKPVADKSILPRISALNGPVAARFPLTNNSSVIQRQEMGDEDYEDELVQMKSAKDGATVSAVTPGVEAGINSLRGGGQPLSASTRAFFEPRFGVDFSGVRVHAHKRAAQVAQLVQAKAFTTGQNIVFGAGEYVPKSRRGRLLLGHELVHVIQQNNSISRAIQRITEDKSKCPLKRDRGEISKSRTTEGILRDIISGDLSWLPPYPSNKLLIADFVIGRTDLRKIEMGPFNLIRDIVKNDKNTKLKLFGFSDCFGDDKRNSDLRHGRVESVFAFLDKLLQSRVILRDMPDLNEYINDNSTAKNRARNRGVLIEIEKAKPILKPKQPIIRPKNVCGPDITSALIKVLEEVKVNYSAWSWWKKKTACNALQDIPLGFSAWDINDLHVRKWIPAIYGPSCATGNAKRGPCDPTVQVGASFPGCYHAGAVNYAIFGVMMKLCGYSRSWMQFLITAYKDNFIYGSCRKCY